MAGHVHTSPHHGHGHGLVDDSVKRSRAGVRAVSLALVVLGLTAAAQAAVLVLSGSVALLAIFVSACVAGYEAVRRMVDPAEVDHLAALAAAGAVGFAGNWIAARIRTRAGHRLDSPALVADGAHARADAYVSLAVVASAALVALGLPVADPFIGLLITALILRITCDSWRTVRRSP